ncbi:uncharacterized protein Z520_09384 [Fonsecaea multimorphosa CBS 102226]|uniref:Uncharacterized protein n=1 Tax=Fonsecaea multimorphosa CBS 102226 TaxID=1442371 RepID=A0A0D2JX34_9EURO|nr:uncharacterized protein Z520_09384 [Fonsecaea multimorphosa CBS 102226]KIX95074.1 hypothetical protein Z520_09384 [Fonsecaea multimorphosa CBS 102226]
MHKTYTDCYGAAGFRGGNWSYALNTNETYGTATAALEEMIAPDERRLACYYLGWDGVEHHQEYATTSLFFEEINKLRPYFGPGTGAWYVKFEKHSSSRES